MSSADRPEKRAPGAADEATRGAEQEPGVGQEPAAREPVAGDDTTDVDDPAEGAESKIDIEEIRPDIDQQGPEAGAS